MGMKRTLKILGRKKVGSYGPPRKPYGKRVANKACRRACVGARREYLLEPTAADVMNDMEVAFFCD